MSELPANSEKPDDRLSRLFPVVGADQPQKRQCSGISRSTGERCTAWAAKGLEQCPGHAGIVKPDPEAGLEARRIQAEARREARLSIRERAAASLDDDWPDVLKALQIGLKDGKPADRARVAVSYVQLVYGRQLQQAQDEKPSSDDIGSMTREQRDRLKAELLAANPELAERLRLVS